MSEQKNEQPFAVFHSGLIPLNALVDSNSYTWHEDPLDGAQLHIGYYELTYTHPTTAPLVEALLWGDMETQGFTHLHSLYRYIESGFYRYKVRAAKVPGHQPQGQVVLHIIETQFLANSVALEVAVLMGSFPVTKALLAQGQGEAMTQAPGSPSGPGVEVEGGASPGGSGRR